MSIADVNRISALESWRSKADARSLEILSEIGELKARIDMLLDEITASRQEVRRDKPR